MAYQRNGYWYRSRREGAGVVTEYLGKASWVADMQALDDYERRLKERERCKTRAEREAELAMDRQVDAVGDLAREITRAVLLVSGYHSHKRQWRRQRHGAVN